MIQKWRQVYSPRVACVPEDMKKKKTVDRPAVALRFHKVTICVGINLKIPVRAAIIYFFHFVAILYEIMYLTNTLKRPNT